MRFEHVKSRWTFNEKTEFVFYAPPHRGVSVSIIKSTVVLPSSVSAPRHYAMMMTFHGRRHGFESGGPPPHFLASGEGQNIA